MVIKWALDDGFTLDAGWGYRWDTFARDRHYLWCRNALQDACRKLGLGFAELAHEVSEELGVTYERCLNGRHPQRVPESEAVVEKALGECVPTKFLTRLPGIHVMKLSALRAHRQLIGFQVYGRTTLHYPRWQFDDEWNPLPIVERLLDLVDEREVSLWILHEEMIRTVRHRKRERRLGELCRNPEDGDWLIAYLDIRFRKRTKGY